MCKIVIKVEENNWSQAVTVARDETGDMSAGGYEVSSQFPSLQTKGQSRTRHLNITLAQKEAFKISNDQVYIPVL